MTSQPSSARKPYQLIFCCGLDQSVVADIGETARDVTPETPTVDAAVAALERSGVSAADLRSRVLVAIGPEVDVTTGVLCYAAVLGFAKRRVDVTVIGQPTLFASKLHEAAAAIPSPPKPEPRPEHTSVGFADTFDVVLNTERPFEPFRTPAVTSRVRHARGVTLDVAGAQMLEAITALLIVSGIRARGAHDRFPDLAVAGTDDPVSLDTLRHDAGELRTRQVAYTLEVLSDGAATSQRQQRLLKAQATTVTDALSLLGARRSETDLDVWHCPRPERHANGDATPSTKIDDGKVRCYGQRCDREFVDPVRLVVDTLGVSGDEAADLLLGEAGEWGARLLAERRGSHPSLVD